MVFRSVPPPSIDSGNWLQVSGIQESGFKSGAESLVGCGRSLMERRLKPNGSEVALKCPRCDSANTKFCYYNNYSLSQPRYFCKTCRRYWTKGGTLRNVPVGGGCRKNKRFKRAGDHPSQTSDSSASVQNTNEMNCTSSPIPEHSNLNLPPPVRSVYFTLLNGGADGFGISYSSAGGTVHQQQVLEHHNLQALKVAAVADPDRGVLRESCNRNGSGTGVMMMMEVPVPSTSNSTASHEVLGNMSNLNSFQSPPNLIPEQAPSLVQINGHLSTIFEAARHHHQNQQVPTSSAPTFPHVSSNSNRFNDGTGVVVNDHRLNSGLQDQDVQIQWHKFTDHDNGGTGTAAQVSLPFDHETHNQLVRAPHDDEIKLRHLIMDGVHTTPLPGGTEVIEENGHPDHVTPYNWHQLPTSEGLLDTSASNNINYWNGATAAAWPDLSFYAPYTNPLI